MPVLKIDDYLKSFTNGELKYFLTVNFSEYFKSTKEKLCFKLNIKRCIYFHQNLMNEVQKFVEIMQSNSYYLLKHNQDSSFENEESSDTTRKILKKNL